MVHCTNLLLLPGVSINDNASVIFGGSDEPCALGNMYSIGAIAMESNGHIQVRTTMEGRTNHRVLQTGALPFAAVCRHRSLGAFWLEGKSHVHQFLRHASCERWVVSQDLCWIVPSTQEKKEEIEWWTLRWQKISQGSSCQSSS